jgi:potassium/hydrogen antiporter
VVVIVSLIAQGWTLAPAARLLDVELPASPKAPGRLDVDLPAAAGRDLMIYTVGPNSRISARGVRRLLQLENTSLIGVLRDGRLLRPRDLDRLDPGDTVLVIAPPAQAAALDELFGERSQPATGTGRFGEFTFDGDLPIGKIAEFYDLAVPEEGRAVPLADFVQARLKRKPLTGDRLRLGDIELIVQSVRNERIAEVGIELEPQTLARPSVAGLRSWLRRGLARRRAEVRRALARLRRSSRRGMPDQGEPGQRQQERQ